MDAQADGEARRTADGIRALFSVNAQPAVIFLKMLDQILVQLGEPFGLCVSATDDTKAEFRTLLPENVSAASHSITFSDHLRITVLRPFRCGEDDGVRVQAVGRATLFIEAVSQALTQFQAHDQVRSYDQILLAGLNAAVAYEHGELGSQERSAGADGDDAGRQLKEFFELVERFLSRKDYQFALPGAQEPRCCRFFLLHRYVSIDGSSAIRLHLFNTQRARLRTTLVEHAAELRPPGTISLEVAELSLAAAFATMQDSIKNSFRTGVTSWVDWPWRRQKIDPRSDLNVARMALNLLDAGWSTAESADQCAVRSAALVIPIHVAGLPWLALVGIFPEPEPSGSVWAGDFYRGLLPYLTTTLRDFAERVYFRELRNAAKQSLDTGGGIDDLNKRVACLAATFPFPQVELREAADGTFVWDGKRASLELPPNRHLSIGATPVEYRLLDASDVIAALTGAQQEIDAAQTLEVRERMSSYVDIGHTLKNLVSSMGWATADREVAVVSQNFDEVWQQGRRDQMRIALDYADRALSLFWMVEGLGDFIRLTGAMTGKFEWSKFLDWLDDAPATAALSIAPQTEYAYAESIFILGKSLCFGWKWRSLIVSLPGSGKEFRWTGDAPEPFTIDAFHFPPLRKGSRGAYAFAFCLAEPIVNAIRALVALPTTAAVKRADPTLRISVGCEREGRDELTVAVTNVSDHPLPEKLSGWESTKHMLRDSGLGQFDPEPEVKPLGDGLYEITVRVRFHPETFAETIRQGAQREKDNGRLGVAKGAPVTSDR